jgi:hypothetical protein
MEATKKAGRLSWMQDPSESTRCLGSHPFSSCLMSRVLVSLWFLLAAAALVSAHMIEVMASKKECFFEDLHKHDKVCPKHISASC